MMDLISVIVGLALGALAPLIFLFRLNSRLTLLSQAKASVDIDLATAREGFNLMRASLNDANGRLLELEQRHEDLRQEKARVDTDMAGLRATLATLGDAKERMTQEFKVIAGEVVKQHGETINKQTKEQMDGLLTPLKENINSFRQGLQTAQTESAKERATLGEQIRKLSEDSARMTLETGNLTRALKSDSQAQGAWGEMILESILERSGLRKGEEYSTQDSFNTEEGKRQRLDVLINLPNGKQIVIDSKVSLTDFEGYVNAGSDEERAIRLKAHVQSIRNHIKILSGKEYHRHTEGGLDYVIMFVPIEAALAAGLKDDPGLTELAAAGNIAIATPTTLMMALKTVANVWHVERRNRNAEAIADRAGRLYDKFVGFAEDMEKLGAQLGSTQKTFESARKKLTGDGGLTRQIEMVKELGAKTGKSIPQALLDQDDVPALPSPE